MFPRMSPLGKVVRLSGYGLEIHRVTHISLEWALACRKTMPQASRLVHRSVEDVVKKPAETRVFRWSAKTDLMGSAQNAVSFFCGALQTFR